MRVSLKAILVFIAFIFLLPSCKSSQEVERIDCSKYGYENYPLRYWEIEYDYMEGEDIISQKVDNNDDETIYQLVGNAFLRANTSLRIKPSDSDINNLTITNLDQARVYTLLKRYGGYRDMLIGYLFIAGDQTFDPGLLGITWDSGEGSRSMVFAGKIRRVYSDYGEKFVKVSIARIIAHELGHQRAISGDPNNYFDHDGNYRDCCSMYQDSSLFKYCSDMFSRVERGKPNFCDKHACEISSTQKWPLSDTSSPYYMIVQPDFKK